MPSAPASILFGFAAAFGLAGMAAAPAQAAPDPAGAKAIFAQAKAISDRDGGALWGRRLYGPILIVDPEDRAVIANQADAGGLLKPSGGVFVGVLPDSELIANTPIEWSGTRWTELMWPLTDDVAKRHATLAHEMFHRIQPSVGMMRPEGGNQHLDTVEGRWLLQLEWRALAKALAAPDVGARKMAAADAILFRRERYRLFPDAAAEENALEVDEGVPEYTGVRLGLPTPAERTAYAVQDLAAFVPAPTFVRSFAYATGPAYGLLLDQAGPAWFDQVRAGQRFDQLLAAAMHLSEPDFATVKARAAFYDDGSLRAAEVKREEARLARLAALKARLVDGPVLTLPGRHMNYQFNPQTLVPLGAGTVYPSMRLSDDWGVLEVDHGGALLDKGMTVASVSAVGIDPSHLKGDGWTLVLKPGWTVQPGVRAGDLAVVQQK